MKKKQRTGPCKIKKITHEGLLYTDSILLRNYKNVSVCILILFHFDIQR